MKRRAHASADPLDTVGHLRSLEAESASQQVADALAVCRTAPVDTLADALAVARTAGREARRAAALHCPTRALAAQRHADAVAAAHAALAQLVAALGGWE